MEREFLGMRCRLIELAAALDRIERNDTLTDPRMAQISESLAILADGQSNRAERMQMAFSLRD